MLILCHSAEKMELNILYILHNQIFVSLIPSCGFEYAYPEVNFSLDRVLAENSNLGEEERRTVVVSLSPQSVLSLAAKFGLNADDCAQKLTGKENDKYTC